MDFISIMFLLFIDGRAMVLISTLLYTSLWVFLVFFISFSLFYGTKKEVPYCQQLISCACVLFTVFPAALLMTFMYMIIVFSLDLKGVTGILVGLIPSIALSAGTFYIKTKLLKRALGPTRQDHASPGAHDKCINDRGKEVTDDQKMLLP